MRCRSTINTSWYLAFVQSRYAVLNIACLTASLSSRPKVCWLSENVAIHVTISSICSPHSLSVSFLLIFFISFSGFVIRANSFFAFSTSYRFLSSVSTLIASALASSLSVTPGVLSTESSTSSVPVLNAKSYNTFLWKSLILFARLAVLEHDSLSSPYQSQQLLQLVPNSIHLWLPAQHQHRSRLRLRQGRRLQIGPDSPHLKHILTPRATKRQNLLLLCEERLLTKPLQTRKLFHDQQTHERKLDIMDVCGHQTSLQNYRATIDSLSLNEKCWKFPRIVTLRKPSMAIQRIPIQFVDKPKQEQHNTRLDVLFGWLAEDS